MQGILLVDKPRGWTSFDVVNYVRKLARQASSLDSPIVGQSDSPKKRPDNKTIGLSDYKTPLPKVKVGHTGTLDPLATGLLVLLVGKEYTRRATELTKLDKTYEVTMKLGEVSTTGDEEGEKKAVSDTVPSETAVLEALDAFQGQIMQVPPVYSAMKINGQRAYKLAREGKSVQLEARPVMIHDLRLTKYDYPYVEFTADVGSGTYIRSLVEDLGETLGTGAYMTALRRTRVGEFKLAQARKVNDEDLLTKLRTL